ncbi:hypothetical protein SAMN05444128_2159 [Pontibacter indicus]|uniref:Uncharacterized protein n=1 Tax=Pontibacter indicus TaxID=1317125 RepID=A0A1R3XES7_9BACT|nr:hypothetical protein SAMN05444128_2159 [Pontibacter indicus]
MLFRTANAGRAFVFKATKLMDIVDTADLFEQVSSR